MTPNAFVITVQQTLEAHRNPEQAAPMARYMKEHFPFYGLKRPEYQALLKPSLQSVKPLADEAWLREATRLLWALPERECHYAAIDLLKTCHKALRPSSLALLEELIPKQAWWDSVDGLTGHVLGPLVRRYPELAADMDRWSQHQNLWLRRAAILHQLGSKRATDTARLFEYCQRNAADPDFFIRKAIGWALREYAKSDPAAVRTFVERSQGVLSPLSVREALKHL